LAASEHNTIAGGTEDEEEAGEEDEKQHGRKLPPKLHHLGE